MTIAWSIGGIIGPVIASALIGDTTNYTLAYATLGIIALAGIVLTFVTKVPRTCSSAQEGALGADSVTR